MTELIIPVIRHERSTAAADIEPTPAEIQRWEDDGGAPLPMSQRHARCHCTADLRQRAAA